MRLRLGTSISMNNIETVGSHCFQKNSEKQWNVFFQYVYILLYNLKELHLLQMGQTSLNRSTKKPNSFLL